MKNKLKVIVRNRSYTLLSEESQEYTEKLADTIDKRMAHMLKGIPSLCAQDAAVLTALDCLDELTKANKNIENIRSQIKDYVDDAGKSRSQVTDYQKEIRMLREKNAQLEEELRKKTTVVRNGSERNFNANDMVSKQINEAINQPAQQLHFGENKPATNFTPNGFNPTGVKH